MTARPLPDLRPWSGWGLVVVVIVACGLGAGFLWFLAVFGGRDYWREYLAAGLIWSVPLMAVARVRHVLGVCSRRLALICAALGVGFLIVGLPAFLDNPGWQF